MNSSYISLEDFDEFRFYSDRPNVGGENEYYVLVGENGCGKSLLLSTLARSLIVKSDEEHYRSLLDVDDIAREYGKVIAISTSPFDKFPLVSTLKKNKIEYLNYNYIGVRGIQGGTVISLMASAIKGMILKFIDGSFKNIPEVLSMLGFDSKVDFIFKPSWKNSSRPSKNEADASLYAYLDDVNFAGVEFSTNVLDYLTGASDSLKKEFYDSFSNVYQLFQEREVLRLSIDFENGSVNKFSEGVWVYEYISDVYKMLGLGLIRLIDVQLVSENIDFGKKISVRRTSSGQQCMLIIMLGIAGCIRDGSHIFIDEPEISFHPKWQDAFMPVLLRTFKNYKGCKFYIATHSPHLVSNLSSTDCYIVSMSDRRVYPAVDYCNKSSDFQLAEVFSAPGIKNEYIVRLCMQILSSFKVNKAVSEGDLEIYNHLLRYKNIVNESDPTYKLVCTAIEVVEKYGND